MVMAPPFAVLVALIAEKVRQPNEKLYVPGTSKDAVINQPYSHKLAPTSSLIGYYRGSTFQRTLGRSHIGFSQPVMMEDSLRRAFDLSGVDRRSREITIEPAINTSSEYSISLVRHCGKGIIVVDLVLDARHKGSETPQSAVHPFSIQEAVSSACAKATTASKRCAGTGHLRNP
ncbi:hypothetical protein BKA70DRAFT_1220105 [Coprinopsis sp. MPI-PUGE-AT-0042]|nr:hypothetical protein BKA70DRAFT_1220105 [Coprinopsis sp. MPI-PUGE-AT-0042]